VRVADGGEFRFAERAAHRSRWLIFSRGGCRKSARWRVAAEIFGSESTSAMSRVEIQHDDLVVVLDTR